MKNILITVIVLVFWQGLLAQTSFSISYPISFPMSDLYDYISKTSFRGISLEFNRRQKPNLDIGLEVGWNTFYEREDSKVYTEGTASVSGVQYRYTNAVPILAGAKVYKNTGNKVSNLYLGLGLGTLYVNRSTDFGLYRITTETWQFCIRPELGVLLKMQPGISGLIGAKYYAGFGTSDLSGQSYLSINVGMVFSASGF